MLLQPFGFLKRIIAAVDAYVTRVLADGGEIIDSAFYNANKTTTANVHVNSKFGIKKDGQNRVSKIYDLYSQDFIQNVGAEQPQHINNVLSFESGETLVSSNTDISFIQTTGIFTIAIECKLNSGAISYFFYAPNARIQLYARASDNLLSFSIAGNSGEKENSYGFGHDFTNYRKLIMKGQGNGQPVLYYLDGQPLNLTSVYGNYQTQSVPAYPFTLGIGSVSVKDLRIENRGWTLTEIANY